MENKDMKSAEDILKKYKSCQHQLDSTIKYSLGDVLSAIQEGIDQFKQGEEIEELKLTIKQQTNGLNALRSQIIELESKQQSPVVSEEMIMKALKDDYFEGWTDEVKSGYSACTVAIKELFQSLSLPVNKEGKKGGRDE